MFARKSMPIGVLFMILVIALALLGVGYAFWSETLTIQGTVQTGEVDVEFSTYDPVECVDTQAGLCQEEPTLKDAAAECVAKFEGPVVDPNDPSNSGPDKLLVTVTGMYPGYHCKVSFDVTSTGNVPVHVKLPKAAPTNPTWIKPDFSGCYQDGVQLHQGQSTGKCTIDLAFTNATAPIENSDPIIFGWTILAHQWNEDPAPEVVAGDPVWTRAAGMRIKGYNTGAEFYLGPMTDPSALPRVEAEYNDFQTVGSKTYPVTFAFDAVEHKLTSSITGPAANLAFDFDDLGAPGCPSANWDAMQILVRDSRADSGVALQNVKLGSFTLGNFATVDKAGSPGAKSWVVTGFDFTKSFQVTADLVVDGYLGNEAIKVELNTGCLP